MQKDYQISVLIAVANGEKYIYENVESWLKQTFENVEILYGVNNSQDNTLSILKSYQEKHNNLFIHDFGETTLADVRNKLVQLATAPYVIIADADDIAHYKLCEVLYHYTCINKDIHLVVPSMSLFEKDFHIKKITNRDYSSFYLNNPQDIRNYFCSKIHTFHGILINKDVIIKNNIQFAPIISHDLPFLRLVFYFAQNVKIIPYEFYGSLYFMRHDFNQVSDSKNTSNLEKITEYIQYNYIDIPKQYDIDHQTWNAQFFKKDMFYGFMAFQSINSLHLGMKSKDILSILENCNCQLKPMGINLDVSLKKIKRELFRFHVFKTIQSSKWLIFIMTILLIIGLRKKQRIYSFLNKQSIKYNQKQLYA